MNKVNICMSEKDAISGYANISVSQIQSMINGSIDDILFKGLDSVNHDQREALIIETLNKLKNNGTATFEFLDMLSIGRDIYNGVASSKYISNLIQNRSSVGYEKDFLELISNHKQFKIKNKYHNDTNIVIVIYKEI